MAISSSEDREVHGFVGKGTQSSVQSTAQLEVQSTTQPVDQAADQPMAQSPTQSEAGSAARSNRPLTPPQAAAANPNRSSWIDANAGSGKTMVLTARVARLLLTGVTPDRILCLTYTRAAAGEMKTRLFATLGGWAMLGDHDLAESLNGLLEQGEAPYRANESDRLDRARRLFAEALEFPGGLRIQTIHSFGFALLRRFPYEAGLPPHVQMMDERTVASLSHSAFDETIRLAESDQDALGRAFRHLTDGATERGLEELREAILVERDEYGEFLERVGEDSLAMKICAALGIPDISPAQAVMPILRPAPGEQDPLEVLAKIRLLMQAHGGKIESEKYADSIKLGITSVMHGHPLRGLRLLRTPFFLANENQRKARTLTKGLQEAILKGPSPGLLEGLNNCIDLLETAETLRRRASVAQSSIAAAAMAADYLRRYEAARRKTGGIDYQDVVERAAHLLTQGAAREWIRYRLDGGIDHILVDEAQDTSPPQWETIRCIAEEFFTSNAQRTVFAVGDPKQSIFSFQGADAVSFVESQQWLEAKMQEAGGKLSRQALEVSYRSSPVVLEFVDQVFRPESFSDMGDGEDVRLLDPKKDSPDWWTTLLGSNGDLSHRAHRDQAPGRVEVWDIVGPNMVTPHEIERAGSLTKAGHGIMASRVANRIATWLKEGTLLPDGRRPIQPEDIMILVQRRSFLSREIMRLLRELGVPAVGSEQTQLEEHLAVQDCIALAEFALLPEDDHALAVTLRSPFCDVSEEQLFDLAWDRRGASLWQRLQSTAGSDLEDTRAFLTDMVAVAGDLGPFEFFERALAQHDRRRRLLRRLGPDAAPPVDQLVSHSLAFQDDGGSSLQEFVYLVHSEGLKAINRAAIRASAVRLLTIHGAKGLEAPIVFVPDADRLPRHATRKRLLWEKLPGLGKTPLFVRTVADDIEGMAEHRERLALEELEESYRLFYVALTRARDWLIVGGSRGKNLISHKSWWARARSAAARIGRPISHLNDPEDSLRRRIGMVFPATLIEREGGEAIAYSPPAIAELPELPAWSEMPAPAPDSPPVWLSPSSLGASDWRKAAASKSDLEDSSDAADRGTLIHLLLERLPGVSSGSERDALAKVLVESFEDKLSKEQRSEARECAERILDNPKFDWVFGSDSVAEAEIAMAGEETRIGGRIDRVVYDGHRVLAVDFKSDTRPPQSPADTSESYLAQLGAYRSTLLAIHSDLACTAAILWTGGEEPQLMEFDNGLVDRAYRRALKVAQSHVEDAGAA